MRTRHSPRNQEILWRQLGREGKQPEPAQSAQQPRTDTEIDAMFWISKTSRNLMKRDAAKAREAGNYNSKEQLCL